MKKSILVFALLLILVSAVVAQDASKGTPKAGRKGRVNLIAAQRLCTQAYAKITDAQKFNEYDLGGHARKAKDLLQQANEELKLAAKSANEKTAGAAATP